MTYQRRRSPRWANPHTSVATPERRSLLEGCSGQEDLWPVLRGHAEWLLGRILSAPAAVVVEPEIPVRARDEPAVFGGAAGAEVFLEVLARRPTARGLPCARQRHLKLGLGKNQNLLPECGLSPSPEQKVLAATENGSHVRARARPDTSSHPARLARTRDPFERPQQCPHQRAHQELEARSAELDDEAFALRVAARRALVDEGDYFTILGIPRSATTHEVNRARESLFASSLQRRCRLGRRTCTATSLPSWKSLPRRTRS